jgi:hypothetical protein
MAWDNSARAIAANSAAVILGSGLGSGFGLGFALAGAGFDATGLGFTAGFGLGLGFATGLGFGLGLVTGFGAFFGLSWLTSTNLALMILGAGFTFSTWLSCDAQLTVIKKIIRTCSSTVASAGRTTMRASTGLA